MKKTEETPSSFASLGLSDKVLAVLDNLKITQPTPIQVKAIPAALEGNDLIGIAQTGTGKTFAFGLPMLVQLSKLKGRGLILLPTRELALQVEDNLRLVGGSFGLRTACLIGGEPLGKQIARLKQKPHVIVATPGRLIDIVKQKLLVLGDVKVLVLDEADMMLDMGFLPQVEEILKTVPKMRQTMLFSATMPQAIAKLAAQYMQLPVTIEVAPAGSTAEKINQEMIVLRKEDKLPEVEKILKKFAGTVLIFTRTRRGAEGLTQKLNRMGHQAVEIHSNRSLEQRKKALASFKDGKARIMVATDIAARGIDVKGIELVINYDLPDDSGDYVHRIGRTGRAGKAGHAISFATPEQYKDVKAIERLIQKEIALVEIAQFNAPIAKAFGGGNRRGGGRSSFGSRGSMNSMTPFRSAPARPSAPAVKSNESRKETYNADYKVAPMTGSSEVASVKPFSKYQGKPNSRPAQKPFKKPEQPKTYRVSAGDLDLQDIGGTFGGGLQKRYRSYAEKLKDLASGNKSEKNSRSGNRDQQSQGRPKFGGNRMGGSRFGKK